MPVQDMVPGAEGIGSFPYLTEMITSLSMMRMLPQSHVEDVRLIESYILVFSTLLLVLNWLRNLTSSTLGARLCLDLLDLVASR
jgi:hypothetical protein